MIISDGYKPKAGTNNKLIICIMGRYISTGIVYQYCFSKKEVERQYEQLFWKKKPFKEMRRTIIDQLFPEIYNCKEDEEYLYVYLSDSLQMDDLISVMEAYFSIVGLNKEAVMEFESIKEKLEKATVKEAYDFAGGKPSYLFQEMELGSYGSYYAYPLIIDEEKLFYNARISTIMIDSSSAKTITEDDLLSYDLFTELLRYRMRPNKLANSMIIFLSP